MQQFVWFFSRGFKALWRVALLGGLLLSIWSLFWIQSTKQLDEWDIFSHFQVAKRIVERIVPRTPMYSDPKKEVTDFLQKNAWNFSEDFKKFARIRYSWLPKAERFFEDVDFREWNIEGMWLAEWKGQQNISLYYNPSELAKKPPLLYFPPYHFSGRSFAILLLNTSLLDTSPFALVVVDINVAQVFATSFENLSQSVDREVNAFFLEKNIHTTDVLFSSMGTQWGLNWIDKNIKKVKHIYAQVALVAKKDQDRTGFINQFSPKIPRDQWAIQDIYPIDNLVPAEIFSTTGFYFDPIIRQNFESKNSTLRNSVLYHSSAVNWTLFSEVWKRYEDGSVERLPHFKEIREKTVCVSAQENDTIQKLSDEEILIGSGTKILTSSGNHIEAFASPKKLLDTIISCNKWIKK